jgi:hypothetical protein
VIKEANRQEAEDQRACVSPEPHVLVKNVDSNDNARENQAHDGLKTRLGTDNVISHRVLRIATNKRDARIALQFQGQLMLGLTQSVQG